MFLSDVAVVVAKFCACFVVFDFGRPNKLDAGNIWVVWKIRVPSVFF